ncbi:hypothetical protein HETIRDRAFT_429792 [Heterobasidion irregulare TC 32-1]|uniref:Uncharacterized protein n=1 Tax=Heterobasidion irregulare (strain TC 32-1) TaxID=747525 RepID=W4JS58_HETIT|nr:uncharacterized protein HETIRDRAFT_429792 [Heterobasidion irregulare TC 32-1]ETW76279.1 hypothetical protein HETIRDRAFT_429792 [Heterobasidion irregulare TC 32-1]
MARNLNDVQDLLDLANEDPALYNSACHNARIKPVYHPFWEAFPYGNIFIAITPDILHQGYQGIVKHLVIWLNDAFGPLEIDARCRMMPPNHNARIFSKGITTLSRVSGKEHRDMCRILLGLVLDLPLPNGRSPVRLVRAVRTLLDFMYLAQYPVHTTHTLKFLDDALTRFHDNKAIFVELGLFGTTDNYNTEQSERLHIDFAKDAYRVTNHKDEYAQMTAWLERKEKILRLELMTKHPSRKAVTLSDLALEYGAIDFADALADFVILHNQPNLHPTLAHKAANNLLIPFQRLSVFHKIKFWNHDAFEREEGPDTLDAVHVRNARKDRQGRAVPGRFDTVLIDDGSAGPRGVTGLHVAQVHVVFELSENVVAELFDPTRLPPPQHFAYVEWFTPFPSAPDPDHGLYMIKHAMQNERRVASVVPVECIRRSCHLYPRFGPPAPRHWSSFNVLQECSVFYVNPFLDRHTEMTVY